MLVILIDCIADHVGHILYSYYFQTRSLILVRHINFSNYNSGLIVSDRELVLALFLIVVCSAFLGRF